MLQYLIVLFASFPPKFNNKFLCFVSLLSSIEYSKTILFRLLLKIIDHLKQTTQQSEAKTTLRRYQQINFK